MHINFLSLLWGREVCLCLGNLPRLVLLHDNWSERSNIQQRSGLITLSLPGLIRARMVESIYWSQARSGLTTMSVSCLRFLRPSLGRAEYHQHAVPPSLLPVLNIVVITMRKIVNGAICVAIPFHTGSYQLRYFSNMISLISTSSPTNHYIYVHNHSRTKLTSNSLQSQ